MELETKKIRLIDIYILIFILLLHKKITCYHLRFTMSKININNNSIKRGACNNKTARTLISKFRLGIDRYNVN